MALRPEGGEGAYLVRLGLDGDLAALLALDDAFDVQLLGVRHKTGGSSIKGPVLSLHALLFWFTQEDGGRPKLGHLSIAAHGGT